MCGRFTLAADPAEIEREFEGARVPDAYTARYNIAPTQPVLAIPNTGDGRLAFFIWGLIPSWAQDPSIGNRLINARGETLAEKPAFRGSYKYRRCLILADGFYEWKASKETKAKVPHYVTMADGRPFAIAGLWSEWRAADGSDVLSCTIVTTSANSLVRPIHDRMPVVLPPQARSTWLDPSPRAPSELANLLKPFAADLMRTLPVSTRVNNPANDDPDCIAPV